jgi:hypothetical protein
MHRTAIAQRVSPINHTASRSELPIPTVVDRRRLSSIVDSDRPLPTTGEKLPNFATLARGRKFCADETKR